MNKITVAVSLIISLTIHYGFSQENKISKSTYFSLERALENPTSVKILKFYWRTTIEDEYVFAQFVNVEEIYLNNFNLKKIPAGIFKLKKLKKLDLSRNDLTSIPPDIKRLKQLQELNLSHNQIKNIPPEAGDLENLETLDISYNKLDTLSGTISHMIGVTYLNLSNNQLKELPEDFKHLVNLRVLNCAQNKFESIPPCLNHLENMVELNLYYNRIVNIPSWVFEKPSLETLNLTLNQIQHLPEFVKSSKMKVLKLGYNDIDSIPASIKYLDSLNSLSLTDNRITVIPEHLYTLKNLEYLDLGQNSVINISPAIKNLTSLKFLNISNGQFETIPSELYQLENLEELLLDNCYHLRYLPDGINHLLNLNRLSISYTGLQQLPGGITKLNELTVLYANHNDIRKLPVDLGNLGKLKKLDVSNNKISEFPSGTDTLKNLEVLNLNKNLITELPSSIGGLTNLTELYLLDNPLKSVPLELSDLQNLKTIEINSPDVMYCIPAFTTDFTLNNSYSDTITGNICNMYNLENLTITESRFTAFPVDIGNLTKLKTLVLRNNEIETLPERIEDLTSLENLIIECNIEHLPAETGLLKNLKKLTIKSKILTGLPPEFSQLQNLEELKINQGRLVTIPDEIFALKNLRRLDLSSNEIKTIPDKISDLELLKYLDLSGNLITEESIPGTILQLKNLSDFNLYYNEITDLETVKEKFNGLRIRGLGYQKVRMYNEESKIIFAILDNDIVVMPKASPGWANNDFKLISTGTCTDMVASVNYDMLPEKMKGLMNKQIITLNAEGDPVYGKIKNFKVVTRRLIEDYRPPWCYKTEPGECYNIADDTIVNYLKQHGTHMLVAEIDNVADNAAIAITDSLTGIHIYHKISSQNINNRVLDEFRNTDAYAGILEEYNKTYKKEYPESPDDWLNHEDASELRTRIFAYHADTIIVSETYIGYPCGGLMDHFVSSVWYYKNGNFVSTPYSNAIPEMIVEIPGIDNPVFVYYNEYSGYAITIDGKEVDKLEVPLEAPWEC